MDAKPNYLKNTVFSDDIVYNKNNEDPAHFILRQNLLTKAGASAYDLTESSKDSIPDSAEKSNSFSEKSSEKNPTG